VIVNPVPPVNVGRTDSTQPPASDNGGTVRAPAPDPTPAPKKEEGYIRIQVRQVPKEEKKPTEPPPTKPGGGNEEEPQEQASANTTPRPDLLLKAQSLQLAGRYREAKSAYQEALRAGVRVGMVHQGIALCQQRLGDRKAAKVAYQNALTAYESEGTLIASRGAETCRIALELLK
jgi:tetratricopeptide (TPR) repeat protein